MNIIMGATGLIVIVILVVQIFKKHDKEDISNIKERNKRVLPYIIGADVIFWTAGILPPPGLFLIGVVIASIGGYIAYRIYSNQAISDKENKAYYWAIPVMAGLILMIIGYAPLVLNKADILIISIHLLPLLKKLHQEPVSLLKK